MKSVLRSFVVIPVLLFVAACSVTDAVTEKISPYRIDIQQGNVITQDMVAKLKPGMTKSQVRFIMGTPLITDSFHADRWDYVYRFNKAGKLTEERKMALFFEQDLLRRVQGDVVAATPESIAEAEAAKNAAAGAPEKASEPSVPHAAPAEEEKGFFGKMLDKIGL
ncbi:MAG: outer membrane protein assembly factor BamE [Betaproteobacteria bacterium]|nr:outer membrane protein assembly factor BamE [Betaproteobacteria bacterium]